MRPGSVHVHLEWYEVIGPATAGILRYALSKQDKRNDRFHAKSRDPFWTDIQSACAEAAFAKGAHKNNPCSVDTFKSKGDVDGYEIRWTEDKDNRLIVRPDDDPGRMYILVVGHVPDFWLVGGIRGADARNDAWWGRPNGGEPCWLVPQSALRRNGKVVPIASQKVNQTSGSAASQRSGQS